ncbi:hypothetical protein [Bradyrhizobium sp.]|nr:hypothetical protein [Bradyrhizobium sp.]
MEFIRIAMLAAQARPAAISRASGGGAAVLSDRAAKPLTLRPRP